jgi:hypothetical protein
VTAQYTYKQLAEAFWRSENTYWAQDKVWIRLIEEHPASISIVKTLEAIARGTSHDDEDLETFAAGPLEDLVRKVVENKNSEAAGAILNSPELSPLLKHVWPIGSYEELQVVARSKGTPSTANKPEISLSRKAIADFWEHQHTYWARQEVDRLIREDPLGAVEALEAITKMAPNKQKLSSMATGEFYDLVKNVIDKPDVATAKMILRSPVLSSLFKYGRTKGTLSRIEDLSGIKVDRVDVTTPKGR